MFFFWHRCFVIWGHGEQWGHQHNSNRSAVEPRWPAKWNLQDDQHTSGIRFAPCFRGSRIRFVGKKIGGDFTIKCHILSLFFHLSYPFHTTTSSESPFVDGSLLVWQPPLLFILNWCWGILPSMWQTAGFFQSKVSWADQSIPLVTNILRIIMLTWRSKNTSYSLLESCRRSHQKISSRVLLNASFRCAEFVSMACSSDPRELASQSGQALLPCGACATSSPRITYALTGKNLLCSWGNRKLFKVDGRVRMSTWHDQERCFLLKIGYFELPKSPSRNAEWAFCNFSSAESESISLRAKESLFLLGCVSLLNGVAFVVRSRSTSLYDTSGFAGRLEYNQMIIVEWEGKIHWPANTGILDLNQKEKSIDLQIQEYWIWIRRKNPLTCKYRNMGAEFWNITRKNN